MSQLSAGAVQLFNDRARACARGSLVPPYGLGAPASGQEMEAQRAVLGLALPHLPDFIADHTLVGQNDSERLAEILERQTQLVANLWKWQSAAFSLRFLYHPQRAGVELAVLARVLSASGQASLAASQLSRDLLGLTMTFGLETADLGAEKLARFRAPLLAAEPRPASTPFIVEVRQRQDVVYLPWVKYECYAVYPYWQPAGTFLPVFEALLRQSLPCVVNLHIEPTHLGEQEMETLGRVAASLQTAGDLQRSSAHSVEYSGRWADPQAAALARIYAAQLRRLGQPFVMVAQVASYDEFAAMSVAQTLGTCFAAPKAAARAEDDLPSGFELVYPREPQEIQAALRTLHHLILTPWGNALAQDHPERARLPYLADARGAAAVFRFPVAVRGGVPGVDVRQAMPGFEPGARRAATAEDEINLGSYQRGGAVNIRLKDLTRHGLVCGLPGSGKTNTCLYVLAQLAERGVPFMVVEPAKTEYRGLIGRPGLENLLVFTLGDETTSPFRLNPFELLPGVRLEVHLEALNVAINAALPQFGVLPTIVEEALEEVYARHGWKLTDRGGEGEHRLFPTMAEFYREAIRAVEERGYSGELHDNIRAAVKGRLGSLLRGSKGRMFNCRRSLPLEMLLHRPVVLELDSLNDDAKSLAMMFLLILLKEYRQMEARRADRKQARLEHLLLIEEAHRIMENVSSVGNPEVSADTRAKSVRMLIDFLVEMRAYGQGILIAEQSPEKLAPDAVRNTNLKIGHMLPGRQDREALAAAMIMDEDQERFMGKLRVGQGAVFMTGFEKATFMAVPPYKDNTGFVDSSPDQAVRKHMADFATQQQGAYLPFDGCRFCGQPCRHREAIEPVTRDKELAEQFREAVLLFEAHPEAEHWPRNWRAVAQACAAAAGRAGMAQEREAAYCYLCHEIDFPFTEHMRREFVHYIEALPAYG